MTVRLSFLPLLLLVLLAPAVHAEKTPIKIGEFGSLSGREAHFGQATHKGITLAVEELNAAGGVLSRPLVLVTEDNRTVPGESATIARRLVAREKVVALLGEVSSSRSLEAAPIAQAARVPMIASVATNPKVTEVGDYIFRVCFIDPFQGRVVAKFARDTIQLHRVAILSSNASAYSMGLAKFFRDDFAAHGGTIAVEQKYTEGDKDFRAPLTAIKAADAEAIFMPGYYTEVALAARQARDLGITVPFLGGDGWPAPQLLEIAGSALDGSFYSAHFSPDDQAPRVRTFIAAYQKRWNGETPDAWSALAYDSVYVLADALRRAGSTDNAKLRDALAATRDFDGVTGRTSFDKHRNPSKPAAIIAIRNGRFEFQQNVQP